jgi:hypothetical protein
LVSDNIGYYFMRLSLLMLIYALFSFSALIGLVPFLVLIGFATILLPLTYGHTHNKGVATAFEDFFFMKPIFPKKAQGNNPKTPHEESS